jgi:hypothetical protein
MTRNLKPCGRKVGRKILLPRDYLWKPGCHEVNVTVAKAAALLYRHSPSNDLLKFSIGSKFLFLSGIYV